MANPLNAKKPTPGKWQNPNLTDTDLHESFNGKNIGVLLREPSVGRWISI